MITLLFLLLGGKVFLQKCFGIANSEAIFKRYFSFERRQHGGLDERTPLVSASEFLVPNWWLRRGGTDRGSMSLGSRLWEFETTTVFSLFSLLPVGQDMNPQKSVPNAMSLFHHIDLIFWNLKPAQMLPSVSCLGHDVLPKQQKSN